MLWLTAVQHCRWHCPLSADANEGIALQCDKQPRASAVQSHTGLSNEAADCAQVSVELSQLHVHARRTHKPLAIDSRRCNCAQNPQANYSRNKLTLMPRKLQTQFTLQNEIMQLLFLILQYHLKPPTMNQAF